MFISRTLKYVKKRKEINAENTAFHNKLDISR